MPKLRDLPHADEKLQHVESGTTYIVVKRLGENRLIIRREDGLKIDRGYSPYGYPPDHMLINEVIWLIRHGIFKREADYS